MAAYTNEQYEALKAAYASGVLTVRHNDETVTYRSLAEMLRILAQMENALGITDGVGAARGTRRTRANFSRGLKDSGDAE